MKKSNYFHLLLWIIFSSSCTTPAPTSQTPPPGTGHFYNIVEYPAYVSGNVMRINTHLHNDSDEDITTQLNDNGTIDFINETGFFQAQRQDSGLTVTLQTAPSTTIPAHGSYSFASNVPFDITGLPKGTYTARLTVKGFGSGSGFDFDLDKGYTFASEPFTIERR